MRSIGPHRRIGEALRAGIGVGVERRFPVARSCPEPGARDLVRIGLAHHVERHVRVAAGVFRGGPAGEARHREVEAAPEEV